MSASSSWERESACGYPDLRFGALRQSRGDGDSDFFQHSESGPQGGGLSWEPSYVPSPEQIPPVTPLSRENSQASLEHLLVSGLQCQPPTECPPCALTLFNVNRKRRLGGVYQRSQQVGSVSSQFLLHARNQFHTLLLAGTHRHTPATSH